jgi:hypothetical protein
MSFEQLISRSHRLTNTEYAIGGLIFFGTLVLRWAYGYIRVRLVSAPQPVLARRSLADR